MKFGVMFANTGPFVEPDAAVELAQAAEAAGCESIWTVEHVVVPAGYASQYPYAKDGRMPGGREDFDIPDPLIWLSYVAAATSKIRLATGVMILPQRNPLVTAKAVATLDRLSKGRMILGIGSGWLEEEFDALGVSFGDRGDRTDEYLEAMKQAWASDTASYGGKFVNFSNVYSRPQPASGHVPIIVGGHSRRAARRAGELGDGFFPGRGHLDELTALFDHARHCAEDSGRDPGALEFTAGGPTSPDYVEQLAEIGVTRMIVPPMDPSQLSKFGEEVISQFSSF
ncbi:MAG: LLM class F420-dependent oxidoreductase [Acidimicrobiales bacterium]|nr:LLM class F420-dependent oxidoreductase [Acidimicrobiales bacterium]MDP6902261.1 LLM class F420-dependent oxidoreductase [Acidimicrobiales bacterium]HJL98451.1 LLM class F420-dependent oxidoreductase [Acidimicrobiales bacterium]